MTLLTTSLFSPNIHWTSGCDNVVVLFQIEDEQERVRQLEDEASRRLIEQLAGEEEQRQLEQERLRQDDEAMARQLVQTMHTVSSEACPPRVRRHTVSSEACPPRVRRHMADRFETNFFF